MSGVCAVLDRRGDLPVRDRTGGVLAALEPFGRDGSALHVADARVGLGCAHMRVLPEDAYDDQPRSADAGAHVLVADVRLDNRGELARLFGITPAVLATVADSELVLRAWERWGEACPCHLLGDFAIVVWDAARQRLFCARDHMGKRVLFYHAAERLFAVASSARALLALPEVPRRLNEEKVAEFLVLVENAATTFYDGVRRLPPGHTLTVGTHELRLERYWWPDPARREHRGSDAAYVDGFNEVFTEAVRSRLRVNGDVGIMLSGGLDSPAVAAVAARELGAEGRVLRAFHAAPPEGFTGRAQPGWTADESGDVAEIATLHANIDLRIARPDGRTLLDGVDEFFDAVGSPLRNPVNRTWYERLYELARERGVGAMLSGQRGNATFSYTGTRGVREYAVTGQWLTLYRELRALSAARGRPVGHLLRHLVLQPLAPAWMAATVRAVRRRGRSSAAVLPREAQASPIHPEFAEAFAVDERIRAAGLDGRSVLRADGRTYRLRMLAGMGDGADILHGFRTRYGIESRDPTADVRVIEYCLAIPESQYLRGGVDRWLVRRALKGMLPERLLNRRTRGTQAADWPQQMTAIRGDIASELERLRESPVASRALDLDRMQELVRQWPDRLGLEHHHDYGLLLLRGVIMGRFIRWFEAQPRDAAPAGRLTHTAQAAAGPEDLHV
jgi:asparagine synthase (glutamine-hydrolysing)